MKYLTRISPKRRYLRFPEFVSDNWFFEQWKAKHPTLNLENLPLVTTIEDLVTEGTGPVNTVDWHEDDHQVVPINWNCHLQLTDDVLNYKLTNTTESRDIWNISIPMNLLANKEANTLWSITDEFVKFAREEQAAGRSVEPRPVSEVDLVNAFSESLPSRSFRILPEQSNIVFFVPKDNPSADDVLVIIVRPWVSTDGNIVIPEDERSTAKYPDGHENWADHTVTFTGNLTKDSRDPIIEIPTSLIPEITVTSSTSSGDVMTVNFSTDPSVNFIYLVQDSGYLPKTKVPVTNGTGNFKVVTTGMDPGDEVRVKMGFRWWVKRSLFTKTL